MHITVSAIRRALEHVPDAFSEVTPEQVARGDDGAIQELWRPPGDLPESLDPDLTPLDGPVQGTPPELETLFEFGADVDLATLDSALGGPLGEEIRQSTLVHGIDALGWYVPFHKRGAQWGIYLPVSRLAYFARTTFGSLPIDFESQFRLAIRAVHQHELFHFGVEYFSAQWELLHGVACYRPARDLRSKKYGYILEEESCANLHMLRRFRRGGPRHGLKGKTDLLYGFTRQQPRGYRVGRNAAADSKYYPRVDRLLRAYAGRAGSSFSISRHEAVNLRGLLPAFPELDWRLCPIHLIDDGQRIGIPPGIIRFIGKIDSSIEETKTFKKQLAKLPEQVASGWKWAKARLRESTLDKGLDFKPWRPGGRGVFSVRLSNQYRAHLELERSSGRWLAIEVGTHKTMGHG